MAVGENATRLARNKRHGLLRARLLKSLTKLLLLNYAGVTILNREAVTL
jgi:hypothetical protein